MQLITYKLLPTRREKVYKSHCPIIQFNYWKNQCQKRVSGEWWWKMLHVKWSTTAIVRKSQSLKYQNLLTPIDNDILPSLRWSLEGSRQYTVGTFLLFAGVAVDSLCAQLQKLAFVFNLLAPLCVRVMATGDNRQLPDDRRTTSQPTSDILANVSHHFPFPIFSQSPQTEKCQLKITWHLGRTRKRVTWNNIQKYI